MDINNHNERQVVCVDNNARPIYNLDNANLLTVGEKYTVIDVEVHSWHTLVTLREFPNEQFNSVLFEEIA